MGVTTWTDAQDEMLLMCLKADHSYMQIAETLGVSKAMVSGRLYRLRKLRPHDVPEKREISLITKIGSKPANKLGEVSTPKLDWKPTSIVIEKPTNQPKPFVQLEHGACSWCLDDIHQEAGAHMMCCAAPVIDKSKREGDRRSSHCAYHYELGTHRP